MRRILLAAVVAVVCLLVTRGTDATGVEWPDLVVAVTLLVCWLLL